jgi:Ni/Fe-hydrogenase subunit HybB-like protein
MIDLIHRIYEADESFRALDFMVKTRLFTSQIVFQIVLGTLVPLALLAVTQVVRLGEKARIRLYVTAGVLTLIGILAMRWNVVIGGSCFQRASSATPRTRWDLRRGKDCFQRCSCCSCRSGFSRYS